MESLFRPAWKRRRKIPTKPNYQLTLDETPLKQVIPLLFLACFPWPQSVSAAMCRKLAHRRGGPSVPESNGSQHGAIPIDEWWILMISVPSGKHTKNYGTFSWDISLFLWWFSILMLKYQRVPPFGYVPSGKLTYCKWSWMTYLLKMLNSP